MIRGFEVPAHVTGETVEGETIVIDLLTGAYHTLAERSADVWQRLSSPDPHAPADADLEVLAVLAAAGLVAAPQGAVDGVDAPPAEAVGLVSYTDMAQLLLADPVHEVDERGWPVLRQQ